MRFAKRWGRSLRASVRNGSGIGSLSRQRPVGPLRNSRRRYRSYGSPLRKWPQNALRRSRTAGMVKMALMVAMASAAPLASAENAESKDCRGHRASAAWTEIVGQMAPPARLVSRANRDQQGHKVRRASVARTVRQGGPVSAACRESPANVARKAKPAQRDLRVAASLSEEPTPLTALTRAETS